MREDPLRLFFGHVQQRPMSASIRSQRITVERIGRSGGRHTKNRRTEKGCNTC